MNNKVGFWSVFALVVGSQIGSGVFMLPASLAAFGSYSVVGWIISGLGAMSLAIIFAKLCERFPKTGGPHVYIEKIFGRDISFFAGWTYWVVSWISSAAVVVAAIGYLSPFIGDQEPIIYLGLEILLLVCMSSLNLFGVSIAGRAEVLFTGLKFLPLFIVPMVAIFFFDSNNFSMSESVENQDISTSLAQVTLLTLWGFVGVESATTPAGSIQNPQKTIPRALILGTLVVAIVYIFNSISIMGLIPGAELQNSSAPYVDASQRLFGGKWHLFISLAASIVCIGTLNAWVLTSGQISLGLAQDKLMPKFFAKTNKRKAPYASIICSCIGVLPLLVLTANKNIAAQVTSVIDFSVTSFLFIYVLCSIVNLILSWQEKKICSIIISLIAVIFCGWVIFETSFTTIMISSLFTLSGIPIYLFWYKAQNR
jgi:APA family basic amino acid/polyamine antiporter